MKNRTMLPALSLGIGLAVGAAATFAGKQEDTEDTVAQVGTGADQLKKLAAEDALELVGELDVVEPADGLDVCTESLLALVSLSSAQGDG